MTNKELRWGAELSVYSRLNRSFVLDGLGAELHYFQSTYGYLPSLVRIRRDLKPRVIVELMRMFNVNPSDAVSEPVWFHIDNTKLPILFNLPAGGEEFMVFTNSTTGVKTSI